MKTLVGIPVIAAATATVFAYLVFIWWLDRYEREPFWLVGLTFVWGATIGVGCGCGINSAILAPVTGLLSKGATLSVAAIVIAPVIEEITKGLVFVPLVTTDHFDNETDGLIYGAATGLGFATVENLMYFFQFMTTPKIGATMLVVMVAIRTLFTAVMHCISSALLGMSIGYARHRSGDLKWLIYPSIGYFLAVGNHAAWNTASVLAGVHGGFQLAGIGLVVVASILLFGLTQWSLKREHDVIRTYLRQEAKRGTIPERHVDIIPYWRKRRREGWVAGSVDREAYVEAATLLAFRHHQLEIADDAEAEQYREEIREFRQKVRSLLGDSTG